MFASIALLKEIAPLPQPSHRPLLISPSPHRPHLRSLLKSAMIACSCLAPLLQDPAALPPDRGRARLALRRHRRHAPREGTQLRPVPTFSISPFLFRTIARCLLLPFPSLFIRHAARPFRSPIPPPPYSSSLDKSAPSRFPLPFLPTLLKPLSPTFSFSAGPEPAGPPAGSSVFLCWAAAPAP